MRIGTVSIELNVLVCPIAERSHKQHEIHFRCLSDETQTLKSSIRPKRKEKQNHFINDNVLHSEIQVRNRIRDR